MEKTKKNWVLPFVHGIIAAYGLACLWLYYQQSIADLSAEVIAFQSDLPLHISMIVEDGWYYSFTAYAYQLLYLLCGHSTIGIACFLAVISWATIYATQRLLLCLGLQVDKASSLLLALSLNLVMPVYVKWIGEFRYVSYQSPSIWHNSTYICMKFVATLTLIMYFQLEPVYRKGLILKQWIGFALLNVVTTGIKPSFLLVFSPIVGISLLIDLFHKVSFGRILAFGSALLPSGLVIIWQNMVLFGDDTGNGISFHPWYTFSLHANIPKLAVVCSVLFCGVVILFTLRSLRREKPYAFLVAMAVLGFLEALCLVESGSRSVDGNFLWGYSFSLFALFAVTAVKWMEMPVTGKGKQLIRVGCGLLYAWHLYCGIYFFAQLLTGATYWMR